jgi:23S rRNA 5-hydroxycytidine C2501 synthase
MLCARGAVRQLQRAVLHELCRRRAQRQPRAVRPTLPPSLPADRSKRSVLEENRYLLSLRDINLSAHLGSLLDAGVRSFKIEGRLKDKNYVMNVVGHYRQQLDALLEGRGLRPASSGQGALRLLPEPAKTFNRGFTDYFLHGRKAPVGSPDTPKAPASRLVKYES